MLELTAALRGCRSTEDALGILVFISEQKVMPLIYSHTSE